MSDMGDFRPGEVEAYNRKTDEKIRTIHVLSAFWYGLSRTGTPVTLGTFTTREKAEVFLDKFKELQGESTEYGEYHIFAELLDPTN